MNHEPGSEPALFHTVANSDVVRTRNIQSTFVLACVPLSPWYRTSILRLQAIDRRVASTVSAVTRQSGFWAWDGHSPQSFQDRKKGLLQTPRHCKPQSPALTVLAVTHCREPNHTNTPNHITPRGQHAFETREKVEGYQYDKPPATPVRPVWRPCRLVDTLMVSPALHAPQRFLDRAGVGRLVPIAQ
ncbi:Delta 8-(E)-sphingolipid desaturase [Venturia inaequalis]|nr:Delta 8-(E)-sphingolipid desaturase [Venturia inaequalis]